MGLKNGKVTLGHSAGDSQVFTTLTRKPGKPSSEHENGREKPPYQVPGRS